MPKGTNQVSKRGDIKQYFLTISDGRVHVRPHTFPNTFGSKEWTVINFRFWDRKKCAAYTHQVIEGYLIFLFTNFCLTSLLKMLPQYCRATTTWQYLELITETKNHNYNLYCESCDQENKQAISR